MGLSICPAEEDRRAYMPLLLLADEQESMVERYLHRGDMLLLEEDGELIGECLVTDEGDGVLEVKSLAVVPGHQGRGCGRALLTYVEEHYRGRYRTVRVGTGDSPLTLPFYRRCGYRESGRIADFFTRNYDRPIVEAGVQLRDMVILEKEL